jgi:predicted RNase H-like HicB family nuclease
LTKQVFAADRAKCYGSVWKPFMKPTPSTDLVLEVIQEADGGYAAECLTENLITQGDTWEELRASLREAVEGYFSDGPKPRSIRLRLVRDEVLSME